MTVRELIASLEKLPPNHRVITHLHSEYADIDPKIELITVWNNGGYYGEPRTEEQKLRAHGAVLISPSYGGN